MKRLMSILLAGALLVGAAAFAEPAVAGNRKGKSKVTKARNANKKKQTNVTKQKNRQHNDASNRQKARGGDANSTASGKAGGGTLLCFNIDSGDNNLQTAGVGRDGFAQNFWTEDDDEGENGGDEGVNNCEGGLGGTITANPGAGGSTNQVNGVLTNQDLNNSAIPSNLGADTGPATAVAP